jgi:hypothetical protein
MGAHNYPERGPPPRTYARHSRPARPGDLTAEERAYIIRRLQDTPRPTKVQVGLEMNPPRCAATVQNVAALHGFTNEQDRGVKPAAPWPGDRDDPACRFDGKRDNWREALFSRIYVPRHMRPDILPGASSAATMEACGEAHCI